MDEGLDATGAGAGTAAGDCGEGSGGGCGCGIDDGGGSGGSTGGGVDCGGGVEATLIAGVWTLLIIDGCTIKFGDGGIRGCGIDIVFACTVVGDEDVLILICDPTGVFRGTAFTTICRPLIGLGDIVDVSGGGSVDVCEDPSGGWIRIEPILLTVVRPVGVCTLTCCYNRK